MGARQERTPNLDDTDEFTLADVKLVLGSAAITEYLPPEERIASAERLLGTALEHLERGNLAPARNHVEMAAEHLAGLHLVNGSVLLRDTISLARAQVEAAITARADEWVMPTTNESRRRVNGFDDWGAKLG